MNSYRWRLSVQLFLTVGLLTSCTLFQDSVEESPTLSAETDLSDTLRDLGFGKYLDQLGFASTQTSISGWDVYHYRTDDLQCILGDEYFIMARDGHEVDKTVIWLAGGGACTPQHPPKPPRLQADSRTVVGSSHRTATDLGCPPRDPLPR